MADRMIAQRCALRLAIERTSSARSSLRVRVRGAAASRKRRFARSRTNAGHVDPAIERHVYAGSRQRSQLAAAATRDVCGRQRSREPVSCGSRCTPRATHRGICRSHRALRRCERTPRHSRRIPTAATRTRECTRDISADRHHAAGCDATAVVEAGSAVAYPLESASPTARRPSSGSPAPTGAT